MTLPLRPLGPPRPRPTRRPVRRTRPAGLRLVHAGAVLALVLGTAACGATGPLAGDTTQVAPVVPGDGDPTRCLPEAVDCDDTPGEEITLAEAVPAGTRAVEMAPDSVAEAWPVFLQEAVVDGRNVTVTFSGGEAPCFVVDHVETDENADRVIVSVLVGVPDPAADCSSQEISIQSVSLQLQEPLGDRPLKDGSRTVPDRGEG